MKVVSLGEALAVEKLQVVLLEVLDAAEEYLFGFGKTLRLGQFRPGEFKCAGDVCNLEESVFRRLDFGNELGTGRKDRESFLQKRGQVVLTVIVVDLELVKGVEFGRMGNEELDDLLKKRIVKSLLASNEVYQEIYHTQFKEENAHA